MLHPVMPFLTEELWHQLGLRDDLILAQWVATDALPQDAAASADIDWLIGLISEIRSARTEVNVPPSAKVVMILISGPEHRNIDRLKRFQTVIQRMARVEVIERTPFSVDSNATIFHDDTEYALLLEGVVDLVAEKARLEKALSAAIKERDALAQRLGNPGFTEKAKPEAVEKAREDYALRASEAERQAAALARLK
jgi:valyl-tRNA synthetase